MPTVIPPDEVFMMTPKPLAETQGAYTIPDFENLSFSEKEGMVANYANRPFQRKGLVYPEGVEANNILKKLIVLLLRSVTSPKSFLREFVRMADYVLRNHYLQRKFYCKFSRELWNLTYLFFRRLGASDELSYSMGRIVATVFQYEENYRFWGQDLFGQTTRQDLILNSRKEIARLAQVFSRRIKVGIQYKITAVVKILSFALYVPKVKAAWKFALKDMNIENLRLDEADRWWMLSSADYDLEDRTIEERFNEHVDVYNMHQLKLIKESIINQQKNATS